MKLKLITVLTVVGVLGTAGTAMAVNADTVTNPDGTSVVATTDVIAPDVTPVTQVTPDPSATNPVDATPTPDPSVLFLQNGNGDVDDSDVSEDANAESHDDSSRVDTVRAVPATPAVPSHESSTENRGE